MNLLVREDHEVVYVERATVNRMMRVEQIVGGRALLHITAVGKLMLGQLGKNGLDRYVSKTSLPRFTRNTITTADRLREAVSEANSKGYAYDNEEAERGVGCVGVLVEYQGRKDLVGLSISAPIDRRSPDWIPLLMKSATLLSDRLSRTPPVD